MKCFCCGEEIVALPEGDPRRESDLVFYDGDGSFVIEVLGEGCRCAVVCWECFHEIDPDMWLDEKSWASCNPVVPIEKLPMFDHDHTRREDPTFYEDVAAKIFDAKEHR